MTGSASRPILIAGGGIAGLTCALAFAQRGFPVRIFERAARLEEAGAGIQLSPNATRVLRGIGVLPDIEAFATRPESLRLRDAKSLRELARVPLGDFAETRWGAPYLVTHRADLQRALLQAIKRHPGIELELGTEVRSASFDDGFVTVRTGPAIQTRLAVGGSLEERSIEKAALLVGADGVGSSLRPAAGLPESRFAGFIAWRATVEADRSSGLINDGSVHAVLHSSAHLIVYPLRRRESLNLVVIVRGGGDPDPDSLPRATSDWHADLKRLLDRASWTPWPIRTIDPRHAWTDPRGLALVGDAVHAMTPFAAQGAAMAIEDAVVLAEEVAGSTDDIAAALARYERLRRPRILRVARRAVLNRLAWHASGPVALVRDAVLQMRPPERLAADLDWLYGWEQDRGLGS